MLRKEAKGSENDAEFCEKICEIFAKQKLRNFAKTFFLTFSFVFRSFLYERNAKNHGYQGKKKSITFLK